MHRPSEGKVGISGTAGSAGSGGFFRLPVRETLERLKDPGKDKRVESPQLSPDAGRATGPELPPVFGDIGGLRDNGEPRGEPITAVDSTRGIWNEGDASPSSCDSSKEARFDDGDDCATKGSTALDSGRWIWSLNEGEARLRWRSIEGLGARLWAAVGVGVVEMRRLKKLLLLDPVYRELDVATCLHPCTKPSCMMDKHCSIGNTWDHGIARWVCKYRPGVCLGECMSVGALCVFACAVLA